MGGGKLEKLTMPKWGLAMTHGTVIDWLVDEGAPIDVGTQLVEVETEKINGVVESTLAGTLRRQVAKAGDQVPVSGLLAVVGDEAVPADQIDRFVEEQAADLAAEQAKVDQVAPQTVQVGDRAIRYLKRGEGGEALVLIHGFGGDLNNWLFNHEALAENYTAYALDMPGHGGSSKNVGDGSVETLAESVGGFLEAVGLERAHLVGHSLGGAVSMALALSRPACIQSLTLIASAGLGPQIDHEYIDGFISAGRRNQLKPVLAKLFADPASLTRQMVEDILKFKRLDGVQGALETIAQQLVKDGAQAINYRDQLSQIGVPIQVLWGAKDRIIPATHAEGLPSSVQARIVDGCGHMAPMESASEVNQVIGAMVGG